MSGINKYNDISEMIKSDIFNGKLKENMALPSIRKLAQRYKVNPATVVRALHILRNQKIVYSNRTNGFYVCEDISQVRQNLILPACPCEQALTNTAILIPPLTRICVAVWKQS